ncbi:D-hexose-6-phosphate mutarotase [Otariodibacter sp.]|uniref:D-hexose-6-phosphate mutarotase n=1 Tax=Otariodibacter sp. TaxID=3030919 RepID=UPI002616808B|nr:D-hexose-6-phosphate mutarotase [Otariodibacter sp.]
MKKIQQITPELSLFEYNEIPVLEINHPKVKAKVALQGAHLFSWQPKHTDQDVFWLSEIEPFKLGSAIRGGVPICYPWFGSLGEPFHGTARIRLWEFNQYEITKDKVFLRFDLKSENGQGLDAQMAMELGDTCTLTLTHQGSGQANPALHSYFNIADISQVELHGLPTTVFNHLTHQQESVSSPRLIAENVDEMYSVENAVTTIVDKGYQRQIEVQHINSTEVVVWNPWHKQTSNMTDTGYKTMVCAETARIHTSLNQGQMIQAKISVKSN